MPGPTCAQIIAPLSKVDDVLTILLMDISNGSELFNASDSPIRIATHKVVSGRVNPAQIAAIQAHINSPHPDLAGVICTLFVLPAGPVPTFEQTLLANGLTNNAFT